MSSDKELIPRGYIDYLKMDYDELGKFIQENITENRSCLTCKYLDDCPEYYQDNQSNYCENWENEDME